MQLKLKRPAIAMIELIFALVIMGITLMSAPQLLSMSIQSTNTAMQQESIAAATSQLSLILTYPWDQNNTSTATGYDILTTAGDDELNATNRWRYSRTFGAFPKSASAIAVDGTDDIDDFNGQTHHVTLYLDEQSKLTDNQGEYLKGAQFDMNITVQYIKDEVTYSASPVVFNKPNKAIVTTTNIKYINVTLTDTTGQVEHNQSVSLYAFACNIGDGSVNAVRVDDGTR